MVAEGHFAGKDMWYNPSCPLTDVLRQSAVGCPLQQWMGLEFGLDFFKSSRTWLADMHEQLVPFFLSFMGNDRREMLLPFESKRINYRWDIGQISFWPPPFPPWLLILTPFFFNGARVCALLSTLLSSSFCLLVFYKWTRGRQGCGKKTMPPLDQAAIVDGSTLIPFKKKNSWFQIDANPKP